MNKIAIILLFAFAFFISGNPQTAASQNEPGKTAQDSPALQEAHKLSAQAIKFYNAGKFDDAVPLAKRALELRKQALGDKDKLVADAYNNLGAIYKGKNAYRDAETAFKKALEIYEATLGKDSPQLLFTINHLAWMVYANGDSIGAEGLFKRSLTISEKAIGKESAVIQSLYNLAEFHQRTGRYESAVSYYKRAIEVLEKIAGPENKEIADVAEKCGCVLNISKKGAEAIAFYARARMIRGKGNASGSATAEGAKIGSNLGNLIAGKATYREEPIYPAAAKQARLSGSVIIEVTINEDGKVIQSRVLCGHDIFAWAAEEAARKWRFAPTLLSGNPVKVIGTITFNFNI
ncbi:MAG: TonB family protein [Acidobacteriota bacterium]